MPLKEGVSTRSCPSSDVDAARRRPSVTLKRVEFVGPGRKELYENGALALLLVIAGIVAYLAMRFEWPSRSPRSSRTCTT